MAVKDHIEKKGMYHKSFQGKIDCPICKKGKIKFIHAGEYNQHTHGQCSTKDCIRWAQ